MNIFDEVDENLFRPLTSINKRKYVDILALIWDKCKRMPMYAIEKSTIFDMVEDYFYGLDEQVELDIEEQEETDGNISDARVIAGGFVRRLKDTGWLTEKEGEYEEESKLAINYKVVPLLKSFQEIISPTIITYNGVRFKEFFVEERNRNNSYFHKGDLDVYGFLILENLKEKTGIPFTPLMMDVSTLERFYQAGLYKELTVSDVKVIEEKKNTKLAAYTDVLQYMLDHNCKVEQESIKAVELME